MILCKDKKKICLITLIFILMLGLLVLNGCSGTTGEKPSGTTSEKPIEARFSHILSPATLYGKIAKMFTDGLNEACDGKLVIKEYPAGQLHGTIKAGMEAVSAGEVEMSFVNNTVLGTYDERFDLLSAPNMIEDFEHLQRFMETDAYKSMEEDLAKEHNLKILGWTWSPAKNYIWNARKPIVTPEDWKGLKVRSTPHQPTRMALVAFGASPIVIDMGEVASAVAQGVVDGVMTSPLSAVDSYKAIDMLPYLTLYHGDWAILDACACIVVNADWYENEVPNDLKAAIEEKVAQITKDTDQMLKDAIAEALKKYEEAPNTTVTYLTEEQTKAWAKIVDENVTKKLREKYPALFDAADATRR